MKTLRDLGMVIVGTTSIVWLPLLFVIVGMYEFVCWTTKKDQF